MSCSVYLENLPKKKKKTKLKVTVQSNSENLYEAITSVASVLIFPFRCKKFHAYQPPDVLN